MSQLMPISNHNIELKNICLTLNNRSILTNISTHIESGEFLSIIGKNGAGKSSLLKTIVGIYRDYAGQVEINNRNVITYNQKDLAKLISFLPQKLSLIYPITVRQFVLMGRYPYLRPLSGYTKNDHDKVDFIMHRLCLQEFSDRLVNELSGGEQQRAMLASAMVQEAKFLVLDEPTAFLDPLQQEILYESLKDIQKNEQIAVIVASHQLALTRKYSDKIFALEEGKVIFSGSADRYFTAENVKLTYGKEVSF